MKMSLGLESKRTYNMIVSTPIYEGSHYIRDRDTTKINFDPSDEESEEEDNTPFKVRKI